MSSRFLSSKKFEPKKEDPISSGFDSMHAKLILSMAASTSKIAGIPHLGGATEIATRIIDITEVCFHKILNN
jgi:hypothetical protein